MSRAPADLPSPHYRRDEVQDLDPAITRYLDEHYLSRLPNLNHPNPKLLIVFSGGSAVGKSTIAHKIERELHGLVLENDAVKRHILRFIPDANNDRLSNLTWSYTMQLYQHLDRVTPNGLVVRDGIIDWYYDRILPVFERADYPLFIIGFDLTREKAVQLIQARGNTATTTAARLQKLLDDHAVHIRRFREHHTPDVILTDANLFDHDLVLQTLRERLNRLGPAAHQG